LKRERLLIWEAEMLHRMDRLMPLPEYLGDAKKAEPASMLEMRLSGASKGLRAIPLSEALKRTH
jgi:hypothetical protein